MQTVSTVFLHKANGAGFLDPSSEDNNVSLSKKLIWVLVYWGFSGKSMTVTRANCESGAVT